MELLLVADGDLDDDDEQILVSSLGSEHFFISGVFPNEFVLPFSSLIISPPSRSLIMIGFVPKKIISQGSNVSLKMSGLYLEHEQFNPGCNHSLFHNILAQ